MQKVTLRTITAADLRPMWEISFGPQADLAWMRFNGPYFEDPVESWESYHSGYGQTLVDNPKSAAICLDGHIIGLVTAYWIDGDLEHWLEIGILLYDEQTWGKGIGSQALHQWLGYLFQHIPHVRHIGFTTWSGNPGMARIGEKCKMTREATIRQVRFWQGEYYDSVKYGILREEYLAEQ